ncbi:cytochrome P450 [Sphingomonas sp. ID0503]|uniref:cytochrome P450 n=1 Tax=Sphingomonas sp. ID0503 TaxID=3399691 RepID=UPI003AFAC777
MTELFTPPYPIPHRSKSSLFRRFLSGWDSWIHTLFERSYTMKMGDIRLPRLDFFIANDPPIVEAVMEDKAGIYPKHAFLKELLDPLIGNSVFSANGEDWRHQREMVNPSFQHTALKRVFPVMRAAVDDLAAKLAAMDLSKPVHIDPLMTHIAADIIFRTLFSVKLDDEGAERIYTSFHRFQEQVQPAAMLRLYGLPLFGYRKRAIRHAAAIHAVFRPIVERRHAAYHAGMKGQPEDILASLLEARHPVTAAPFSVDELMEQISTIFLAGHETAASSMTWALYLLGECRDWQDACRGEIAAQVGPDGTTFEDTRALPLTRNVWQETLRLYPPVSFFLRAVTRDTTMRGKRMKKGAMLVISPWLIQRNSNHWKCPHAFDPERFSRPEDKEACRHAFMPFGKGPRVCIGAGFANQEGVLVIAEMLRRFRFTALPHDKPQPVSRLTLRPKHGARLMVEAL